jgi:hypothetical protein
MALAQSPKTSVKDYLLCGSWGFGSGPLDIVDSTPTPEPINIATMWYKHEDS